MGGRQGMKVVEFHIGCQGHVGARVTLRYRFVSTALRGMGISICLVGAVVGSSPDFLQSHCTHPLICVIV